MKLCSKCNTEKPESEFWKCKGNNDGLSYWCKECAHENSEKWRLAHLDQVRENIRKRREARRDMGLCHHCSEPQLPGQTLCEKHWIIRKARFRLGSGTKALAAKLKDRFVSQSETCPYTGTHLDLGKNTHLDHIVPRTRNSELASDIENTEWISGVINVAKRDLTKEEFIALCRLVTRYTKDVKVPSSAWQELQRRLLEDPARH